MLRRTFALAAAAVVTACSDAPSEPSAGAPARIVIEDNPGLIDVGDTARLAARPYDADGRLVLRDAPIAWRSLDTSIARIDDAGLVTGWDGGTTRIVATTGAAADTATVRVALRVRSVELTVVNVSFRTDSNNYVGHTMSLRAAAFDGRGRRLVTVPFTYSVADTTVASAPVPESTNSLFARSVARRAGTAVFRAEVNGVRGERSVEILAPPAITVVETRSER